MSRSQVAISALSEMDPQFGVLVDTLFGKAVDAQELWSYVYLPDGVAKMLEVEKANPDQADLNAGSARRKKRGALVAGGTVAAAGGALAVPGVRRALRRTGRTRPNTGATVKANPAFKPTGKRVDDFKVEYGDFSHLRSGSIKDSGVKVERKSQELALRKSDDTVWEVEFVKTDSEKRQVFGWASIVSKDGKPVVDRQGDWIDPEEIEKAAYTYVVKSRTGGHQHRRTEEGAPFKAADMIESFVVTDEKVEKMGLPQDTPRGWWVGYHVSDDDAWQRIKDGRITGFSIHGRGKRQAVGDFAEVL